MCPLHDVHQRLEDAVRMWKRANDSYFSPDDFRVAVQPCIQAFRSVTWVLQNNKDKINGFEAWYSNWQDKMRADAVLRWLVEARNQIEKQGDLQTRSKLKATISDSWHDEPVFECELSPLTPADKIADQVLEQFQTPVTSEEALLKIERLWVDANLPNYEILEALAHCYVFLYELIEDAHHHLISPLSQPNCPSSSSEGRSILEYTVSLASPRLVWVKLKNREQAIVTPTFAKITDESLDDAGKHYQIDPSLLHGLGKSASFRDECVGWFQLAKHMLRVDKHHQPTALLKTEKTIHIVALRMNDKAEKHLAIRNLAQQAKRLNARAVYFINEVWLSTAQKVSDQFYKVDTKTRGEGLVLHGLTIEGEFLTCTAEFQRVGGAIVIGEDSINSEVFPNILRPFCDVWKIQPLEK
jgi:hypothetical protein